MVLVLDGVWYNDSKKNLDCFFFGSGNGEFGLSLASFICFVVNGTLFLLVS